MPRVDDILMAQSRKAPSTVDALMAPGTDPSWKRTDGSQKGMGFLGPLRAKDGRTSTELSIGVNFDGKEQEIPSLVPTLSQDEINHMLGGNAPTDAIVDKAVEHARMRMKQGKPVYAVPGDY